MAKRKKIKVEFTPGNTRRYLIDFPDEKEPEKPNEKIQAESEIQALRAKIQKMLPDLDMPETSLTYRVSSRMIKIYEADIKRLEKEV